MSDLEIVNPVPVEEAGGWLRTLSTTFFGDPHADSFAHRVDAWRRSWLAERTWGARADSRWVATLATQPRSLSVPGPGGACTELTVDALTAVTVAATHRRRGVLTRMLTSSLAAAKERGDALSVLIAAQWPIYGRFGYAPAVRGANYTYFPSHPAAQVTPAARGRVRQVDPDDAGRVGPAVHEAQLRVRAGQVSRPARWWAVRFGLDGYTPVREGAVPAYVVHEGPAGVDGLLAWRPKRDFDIVGNLAVIEVVDLVAASDDAYRNLWAYLSGIDAVGEVTLIDRPVDEPVRWLLADGRALRQTYAGDHTWVRLLDVPAALAARSYATEGRVVIEVTDDLTGFANGRFRLDGGPHGADCTTTTEPADLRLSHRALAGAYLGGYRLRELAIASGVDEATPGALAKADAMLGIAPAPWNSTDF